jgi:hypothetical protein
MAKRPPKDDGKHGADRIPVAELEAVYGLLKAGNKREASLKLEALAVQHKLKSYEVHHIVGAHQARLKAEAQ